MDRGVNGDRGSRSSTINAHVHTAEKGRWLSSRLREDISWRNVGFFVVGLLSPLWSSRTSSGGTATWFRPPATRTSALPMNTNGGNGSLRRSSSWRWSKRERLRHMFMGLTVFAILLSVVLPLQKYYRANSQFSDKFVAFPPDNIKISAVIMNHARPRLLQQSDLLAVLCRHPAIQQILILHSNPATTFTNAQLTNVPASGKDKIQHIDASEQNQLLGLAVRFHYCSSLCTNEWVLHVDDDMELEASAINDLLQHMLHNPHRIVGHYGRRYSYWRAPHRQGYDTTMLTGQAVEVVLTKILLMERSICSEFLKYAPLMDDLLPESHPRWNGEDIFVNLVANHYYKVPPNGPYNNYAVADLHVWDVDTTNSNYDNNTDTGVSGNMDRTQLWQVGPTRWWQSYRKASAHTQYRGRLWATAKQRLAAIRD